MDLSAFRGKLGLCRIISLFAGLLVFLTIVSSQFYQASQVSVGVSSQFYQASHVGVGLGGVRIDVAPSPNWFGLFGFIDVLIYLFQLAWAAILIRTAHRPGLDKDVVKQIDGGLNGAAGGVICLISVWWIVLLIYAHWNVIGYIYCPLVGSCYPKVMLGFAIISWIFATVQGIFSIILGFSLFRDLLKDNGDGETTQAEDTTPNSDPAPVASTASHGGVSSRTTAV